MTVYLSNINSAYKRALQDVAAQLETVDGGTTTIRDENVITAIQEFSKRVPNIVVTDQAAVGSTQIANLPNDWINEFSRVLSIESPIGSIPPTYLIEQKDWDYYFSTTAQQIMFYLPPTTIWRLKYTKFYATTNPLDIPDIFVRVIGRLAASLSLAYLANTYAETRDPTLGADAVNYRGKSREFADAAKRLSEQVESEIRIFEMNWMHKHDPYRYRGYVRQGRGGVPFL